MMTVETFMALFDSEEMWAIPMSEFSGRVWDEVDRFRILFRQFIRMPGNDAIAKEWRGCGAPRALRLLSRERAAELYEGYRALKKEQMLERRRKSEMRHLCMNLLEAAKTFHRFQMLPERHTLTKVRKKLAIRCDTCGWYWGIEPGSLDIPLLPQFASKEET